VPAIQCASEAYRNQRLHSQITAADRISNPIAAELDGKPVTAVGGTSRFSVMAQCTR